MQKEFKHPNGERLTVTSVIQLPYVTLSIGNKETVHTVGFNVMRKDIDELIEFLQEAKKR